MNDFIDDLEDAFDPDHFSSDEVLIFFFVLLGLTVLSAIIIAAMKGSQNAQTAPRPTETRWAKVVDKQSFSGGAPLSMSQMWVLFEFSDGSRLRLNTPAAQTITLGDSGMLTWQGDAMISFSQGIGAQQSRSQASGSYNMENLPAWKRVEIMEAKKREAEKAAAEKAAEEPVEKPVEEAAQAPKAKKYCVYCGEPMGDGHMFCGACGKRRE